MNKRFKLIMLAVLTAFLIGAAPLYPLQAANLENPGLLPSNPFYFFKNWTRGLRRALTFNEVNRVDLELDILDEKAGEAAKINKIFSNNEIFSKNAVDNYIAALQRFYQISDYSRENLDRVYVELIGHAAILSVAPEPQIIQKNQLNLINHLIKTNDSTEAFRSAVRAAAFDPSFSGAFSLKAGEMAGQLELLVSPSDAYQMRRLKEDVLIDFAYRYDETVAQEFLLGGDLLHRLMALDVARNLAPDPEVKSRVSLARQSILDQAASNISSELVVNYLDFSQSLFNELRRSTGSKNILFQPQFHLDQVQSFIKAGQLSSAVGQSSLAATSIQGSLFYLVAKPEAEPYLKELNILKQDLSDLDSGDQSLITAAEEKIVNLADSSNLSKVEFPNDSLEKSLLNIRALLAQIRQNQ